jgi:peptidoglycan/LPS O-acetylase OafA/YrhL
VKRTQPLAAHWTRWALAALLAVAVVPLFELPLWLGRDVIAWPTTLAAAAALAGAILLVLQDARRRTFAWMAAAAPVVVAVAAVVHNLEYAVTGVEEPTFIVTAIVGGPALLLAGVAGLLWTTVRDRQQRRAGEAHAAH